MTAPPAASGRGRLVGLLLFCWIGSWPLAAPAVEMLNSGELVEQAASLKAREDAVAAAEKRLAEEKAELERLQKDVTEQLARLAEIQKDVEGKIAYIESLNVRDREFANLVKVYSAMSPSKLAPLLDKMEDDKVARVLRAMKADLVAKIIVKLDPDKAVRVSGLLGLLQ
ncbi:MAG: hypothetical protein AB1568_03105 [Thermodesulfobacteriota bacterium]